MTRRCSKICQLQVLIVVRTVQLQLDRMKTLYVVYVQLYAYSMHVHWHCTLYVVL